MRSDPTVRSLGGDEVICTAYEDVRQRIREITNGEGAKRAIDCVAGELGAEIDLLLLAPADHVDGAEAVNSGKLQDKFSDAGSCRCL